ncbi:protein GRINL1A [Osmerus eperlanus]|uniref:protein GRINL1A n=1 Tax=Osmerus eperlanus TaxID=29151 RepID=UPI002E142C7C
MSSSWTERQGQVGDLRNKSKEELCELLSRQEKLLSNKRFIQTLPDKGRKILDFAERVRLALINNEEEKSKQDKLASVRSELQSKYQQALTQRAPSVHNKPETSQQGRQGGDAALGRVQDMDTSPLSPHMQPTVLSQQDNTASYLCAVVAIETSPAGNTGFPQNSDSPKESDLAEALQRVSLSDPTTVGSSGSSKDVSNSPVANANPFSGGQPMKKTHYTELVERNEKNPETKKHKFKPNQTLNPRADVSPSGSLSPGPSTGGLVPSPLSAEVRRERDRKHLNDITAARLPPLHHSPAQMLSLHESACLLQDQTKKQLELQAKLAAQKLCDGLRISMGSYSPEGGPLAVYREVHDDEDSDED